MNIKSSFTVYTAPLHALILILFSFHTSGLGYPGLTWIYCISTNKSFSSPKTSSRTPYSNSKQQEKQKHSAENTINFSMLTAALEDLAAAIKLPLQQYKLEDGSPLYEARKTVFLLIAQSKECEKQLQMIERNDEPARKKLHDQWTHVNQQMSQTKTSIYNLLQSPDSNLDSTIKAQQEEVLRQQQVLVDQRASMDRRLAVAIGVSTARKKAKGFYPDIVPDTPPNIILPPPKHPSTQAPKHQASVRD